MHLLRGFRQKWTFQLSLPCFSRYNFNHANHICGKKHYITLSHEPLIYILFFSFCFASIFLWTVFNKYFCSFPGFSGLVPCHSGVVNPSIIGFSREVETSTKPSTKLRTGTIRPRGRTKRRRTSPGTRCFCWQQLRSRPTGMSHCQRTAV